MISAASLHAEVKEVRSYQIHESTDPASDRGVMAITPEQDVLSFVANRDGKWRLTRVRNWLGPNPVEQTVDVPGIVIPEESKGIPVFGAELFVTQDGHFGISVVAIDFGADAVVSVIDLHTFEVVTTDRRQGNSFSHYYVDSVGRLVVLEDTSIEDGFSRGAYYETTLHFITLPTLVPSGECRFSETVKKGVTLHDHDCGRALSKLLDGLVDSRGLPFSGISSHNPDCEVTAASRSGRFRTEDCKNQPGSIISVKNGVRIGTINETTRSLDARFAEHDGRDYLLVLEGGTQLKIYEIKDTRP
jgi:hypothetical protein